MKNKYFYPIFKLKAKSWIRYWLLKKTEFKGKLSEILEGSSFTLNNTLSMKFNLFEIYGNSIQDGEPSPDNEVPILNSGDNGNITEKIINKNWLIWELPYTVSTAGNIRLRNIPELEVGENYYFVGKCSDGTVLSSANSACVWHQGNTQLLNRAPKVTFTGIDISSATGFYIYVTSALIGKTISEFMLVKGTYDSSNVPEYVPHEEQTYTIQVLQPMLSLGDVRDVFFKNTKDSEYYDENLVENGWYEGHFINRYIFTGEERFTKLNSNYNTVFQFTGLNTLIKKPAISSDIMQTLSNYFNGGYSANNIFGSNVVGLGVNSSGNINIGLGIDSQITTETELKAWFTEKYTNGTPVYIDYPLATPLNLPCTEEQIEILENLPKTYAGQTNIYSPDEVKPFLKIQYWESDTNG